MYMMILIQHCHIVVVIVVLIDVSTQIRVIVFVPRQWRGFFLCYPVRKCRAYARIYRIHWIAAPSAMVRNESEYVKTSASAV